MGDDKWWQGCADPSPMVGIGGVSGRKRRLFAVACCRRIPNLEQLPECRAAIDAAERFAEGLCSREEMFVAAEALSSSTWQEAAANDCAAYFRDADAGEYASYKVADGLAGGTDVKSQLRIHAGLLRDIFGNPFRPVEFSPDWRTDTAVSLAWQMYEPRDFSLMPILADALQDAGCEHPDILDHCRDPNGTHVRGCWVVDLVLGK
jgi:hypothetical protein